MNCKAFYGILRKLYFFARKILCKNTKSLNFWHGIMNGIGDGRFDPKENCTREQAIVTFFRMRTL